jgi:CheY-like chemotaxis protein
VSGIGSASNNGQTNGSINSALATVLLVEDNEDNVLTVADYLTFKGYEVVVARNGRECLDLFATAHPHVIIMDIQMPEMDGLEAIRYLRSMPGAPRTPIVALTAMAMLGDRERCLAAGADHYLSKPVSLRELTAVIETCLKRS